MSATPRPWTVERHDQDDGSINYEIWTNGWVLTPAYHRVVTLSDADNERAREDAALIVRAVNAFEDLVEALRKIAEGDGCLIISAQGAATKFQEVAIAAIAALAKAEAL